MTAPPGAPTISVVIPSYQRLERIPALVSAYLEQGADQVVVVLDGPHPQWVEHLSATAADERVLVTELPQNVGLALARIAGLRVATGEIVLAVDDDVVPLEGFVTRHREFHGSGGDRVLMGYMPVAVPPRRGRDDAPTFVYARDYEKQAAAWRSGDSATILGSLWGGTLSIPRGLYARAEELKPSVRIEYNEDLDLGLRLQRLGATASFDQHAQAAHHHQRGWESYLRECTLRGAAIADLEARWGTRPAQLTPMIVIPPGYSRPLGWVQRRIAGRDRAGLLEHALTLAYRAAGAAGRWSIQDGITRMVRRALAMRGYRLAGEQRDAEGR
ncbi:glycosyltransferase [Microbacterium sp. zg.B48]|uniref:glycosyltransferase n=1 Tax=Microbacterium sp. zg.B48 TaxID=2969408 RepID=UPI00214AD282|nr:glycosyltransferase family 2 protein [Microbacterium sp. zg.B48]MCR2763284.1 glycosyltransferase [Microbacterium sp. zg.B48]